MVDNPEYPHPTSIQTWQQLAERAEEFSRDRWLFRGVTKNEYPLTPRIGREEWRKQYLPRERRFAQQTRPFEVYEEQRLLDFFKREARPRISYTPHDDIEW